MGKTAKSRDLTKVEPDHEDHSDGPAIVRTGEIIEVKIQSRALLLVGGILGTASFIHLILDVDGVASVLTSLAIMIAVDQPQYATRMFRQLNKLAMKVRGRR